MKKSQGSSRFINQINTRSLLRGSLLMLIMAMTLLFSSTCVWAAPFSTFVQFTQPDNEQITLWGEGDEFHAVFETTTGYTVVFDPQQQAYFYATRAADGKRLLSTGVHAHKQPPQSLGRHLRIDRDAVAAAAKARHTQWDAETGLSKRWSLLKAQTLGTPVAQNGTEALPAPPQTATIGVKAGLTLLIDFPDAPATISQTEIESFLNSDSYTGFGNNGSVKKYFSDVSNGRLTYTNVVTFYVRMAQPKSYYNNTAKDCGAQGRLLINDALAILKARSDYASTILPAFNSLTTDGSGYVAAFNVFFAGSDSGVWSYGLWPHSWALASPVALGNGTSVYRYQVTNVGTALQLRTFCHENGHMLCGLPDLYDYGYDSTGGAGNFSLMGYGASNTNPSQVDAYLKLAAGWATAIDLTSSSSLSGTLVAAPDSGYDTFYRYRKPGVATEYYLLENRQKAGHDAALPGAGVAVWHVDELGNRDNQSLAPNTSHANYELTLVQADNLWHFENNQNYGDPSDLYYLGNSAAAYTNSLDDASSPHAHWWDGTSSLLNLNGFSALGMGMMFNVGGGSSNPDFTVAASPASITAVQGSSATTTVTTSVAGGFDSAVSLSASGLPVGATTVFIPALIAAPGSGSSALTLTVGSATPTGTYTVTVTGDGGGKTHSATLSFTVTAPPTYSISGTVRSGSATGPGLAGATVTIAGKTVTTSNRGTFTLSGIPAGTYSLSISKTGYITYTNDAYAVGSNQSGLNFFLTAIPTYSMSGTVRSGSATGPILAGATVSIAGKTATTGKKGTFSISGISAGTYTLTVSKSGYGTYTDNAYSVGSNQSSLNFFLLP